MPEQREPAYLSSVPQIDVAKPEHDDPGHPAHRSLIGIPLERLRVPEPRCQVHSQVVTAVDVPLAIGAL